MGVIARFIGLPLLCLSLASAATGRPAESDTRWHPAAHVARPQADGGLSLDEAVARAERRHDARAVRAEAGNEGGRTVYRIRLLSSDGRVFEVKVDARTGAYL